MTLASAQLASFFVQASVVGFGFGEVRWRRRRCVRRSNAVGSSQAGCLAGQASLLRSTHGGVRVLPSNTAVKRTPVNRFRSSKRGGRRRLPLR